MATSNYTPNLHLSAWEDTDRPKRADFVSDNQIIDTQLGGHINNAAIHVTSAEKAKLSEPFTTALYVGTGAQERTISLDFQPSLVFVYKRGVPLVKYSSSVNVINAAVGCYGHGSSVGISVSSSGVTVIESEASDGMRVSLNESGSQYTIIAFK